METQTFACTETVNKHDSNSDRFNASGVDLLRILAVQCIQGK